MFSTLWGALDLRRYKQHRKRNQAHPPLLPSSPNVSVKEKQTQEMTSPNMTSGSMCKALTFDIESAVKRRRNKVLPQRGREQSPPRAQETMHRQAGGAGGRTGSQRQMGRVAVSLDNLKVVQDSHNVLRHEDVAGVDGHAGHRDQQGVWRGAVKDGLGEEEHKFTEVPVPKWAFSQVHILNIEPVVQDLIG